jgi:hypothetical protein
MGRIATITDAEKIRSAVTFIQRYEDGDRLLVAGSLSRDTPPDEIAALARTLGLQWHGE